MKRNYILNISAEEIQNKMDAKLTETELVDVISSHLNRMELLLDKIEKISDSKKSLQDTCVSVLCTMVNNIENELSRYYKELTKRGFHFPLQNNNI